MSLKYNKPNNNKNSNLTQLHNVSSEPLIDEMSIKTKCPTK